MRVIRAALLSALCTFLVVPPANHSVRAQTPAVPAQTGNRPVNGLLMSIAHGDAALRTVNAIRVTVTFQNLTIHDMTLLLGAGCGKGFGRTNAVRLILTGPNGASPVLLPFLGSGPPYSAGICGGVVTHAVAVLRTGASRSYSLELGNYMDQTDSKKYREMRFPPGTYSLQTQLSLKLSDYSFQYPPTALAWTGTIASNTLQVRFDNEFGVPVWAID